MKSNEDIHKKKRKYYPVSVILSFILSMLIAILGYLAGASIGVFNSNIIIDSAEKENYYNNVYNKIVDKTVDLGKPMMLGESVFEGVYDYSKLCDDINGTYLAMANNESYDVDTSGIRDIIDTNIHNYAKEQNIAIGDEQAETIDLFIAELEQNYKSSMEIPFVTYYVSVRSMYRKYFLMISAVVLVLLVIGVIITLRTHTYIYRSLRYVTYAVLAAALMTGVPMLFLYIQGRYKDLGIKPEYMYNMYVDVINKSLLTFVGVAVVYVVIAALLIVLTVKLKNKSKKRVYSSER